METDHHWQPSASLTTLRLRAQFLATIRQFFQSLGYLEVETPILSHYGVTDVYLSSIKTEVLKQTCFLQTSPEYHMKRLLAAGSGPIFQLARVFRDDEQGRWHNPEFTLLEWYQLGINHHALMDEVNDFLQLILACPPMQRLTYQHVFSQYCQLDPFNVSVSQLKQALLSFGLEDVLNANETDTDQYLFLLMSHVIEPKLAPSPAPIAIYHFPPSQAALAQINHGVAERFEVYFKGIELANGFHELTDVNAQKNRFEQDKKARQTKGQPSPEIDKYFMQALQHGLPPCSGVALGIDRLLALALGMSSISETLTFDFNRA